MNKYRKNTRIAGILLLAGIVAGLFSVVPSIDSSAYLVETAEHVMQVRVGVLCHLIMALAYIGIAISLYPIIREYNRGLSLGFLSFRIIATVFLVMGIISLLLLLKVSQEYLVVNDSDKSLLIFIGGLLRSGRDYSNHIAMVISLCIGNIMFYIVIFQTQFIPRWLIFWGMAGALLAIIASLLVLFEAVNIITPVYIGLNAPMALQELILGLWLLLKGFKNKESDSGRTASLTIKRRQYS